MPLDINNRQSTANYKDNSYGSRVPLASGWLVIQDANILANVKVGNEAVSDALAVDKLLSPGYYQFAGAAKEGLILVEFKDAVAGTHATVNGQFVEAGKAALLAQSQFAAGASAGMVTGLIPAAGTAPTSGTGFSYTHTNGTGVYVFTYTTAFAATPALVAAIADATASPAGLLISAQSPGGFTIRTDSAGAATDHAFNFVAVPVV